MSIAKRLIIGTVLASLSLTALAHPDPAVHGHGFGLWRNIGHFVSGLDYLVVMALLVVWMLHSSAARHGRLFRGRSQRQCRYGENKHQRQDDQPG